MGDTDGSISWFECSKRAIIPIELPSSSMNISRSLRQVINKKVFDIRIDKKFNSVITNCANRSNTWINSLISSAYVELFKKGFAHSIEAWQNGKLVGGLYGVALKGAFFGESMFHLESNASKVCAVKLYEVLKKNKFILFDIQMMTPVFEIFGAIEISKRAYLDILDRALELERKFSCKR